MATKFQIEISNDGHQHCWHAYQGPIWMVLPNGHVVQKCCHCAASRTIHAEHITDDRRHLTSNTSWQPPKGVRI